MYKNKTKRQHAKDHAEAMNKRATTIQSKFRQFKAKELTKYKKAQNEEGKNDPPALPPPTQLDMGGGGGRKTRSQVAIEESTKGEEKTQDPSPVKAKALVNNYVKDLMKGIKIQVIEEGQTIEKEVLSVEQLKGSRNEIPQPLRDSLKKHFNKEFKSTSSLNSVYNWYQKLGAAVMTTTFEGNDNYYIFI